MESTAAMRIEASKEVSGWRLSFAAGLAPLIAGFILMISDLYNISNADGLWWTGLGSLRFSFRSLTDVGPDVGPFINLGFIGPVNIIGAAVLAIAVAYYGLREGRKWAWLILAFYLAWVGFHDAFAAFRFYLATGQVAFVFPLAFVTLMSLGLARSRASVFSAEPATKKGAPRYAKTPK
jgi:hypothetical protein